MCLGPINEQGGEGIDVSGTGNGGGAGVVGGFSRDGCGEYGRDLNSEDMFRMSFRV